jgi:outer membrane protein OmpA-like peptidoglycan-associated protein
MPPPPERRPGSVQKKFETAALPQSHIAPEGGCAEVARSAARDVAVHFARGFARLDARGKALLDGLAAAAERCPQVAIRISGHADTTGTTRHNMALSRRRARVVASYLSDKGIDAGRVVAIGYGDTQPIAPNNSAENRARNRRIEVEVTHGVPPLPVRK